MKTMELYVHYPFCAQKCRYCDFLSAPAGAAQREGYMEALMREIRLCGPIYEDYKISTVFIGGGTPSIMSPQNLNILTQTLHQYFNIEEGCEFTIEANPGTLTDAFLEAAVHGHINRISLGPEGPKHFDMNLTRAKFDELTHDLVERTVIPVQNALRDAGITASELSKVLLVGGSTRIPAVQDKVRQLTGKEPSKNLNPDECVAVGASIQGGKLAGDTGAGDILLLDVTPLTLSIETMGGIATHLIDRNTTIPTRKSQIFSTAADNQTAVDINVVQGERQFARDNKSLGQFRLDGIAPARRGVPQIEVTFDIDANGIVNVSAKDLGTGKEQHITITAGSNMSEDEISKAVKEAAEFEAQDKKRKEGVEAKNEADAMIFQTENALNEVGDKVSADDKAKVQSEIDSLKSLLSNCNTDDLTDAQIEDIKAGKQRLMDAAQGVFAKMYEAAGAQAGAGPQGAGPNPGADTSYQNNDDVVDADYKEV